MLMTRFPTIYDFRTTFAAHNIPYGMRDAELCPSWICDLPFSAPIDAPDLIPTGSMVRVDPKNPSVAPFGCADWFIRPRP